MNDEDGYCLAEFRASLHDTQAKRDDLSCEEEVDNFTRVVLHKSANDTERCKTQVFERPRLGSCVEERVKEEWDVRCECISYVASVWCLTYRLRIGREFRYEKRHTGEAQERCRHGY